jgi:hypothetical protein
MWIEKGQLRAVRRRCDLEQQRRQFGTHHLDAHHRQGRDRRESANGGIWWRDLVEALVATWRELEEANSGGIGRRIWWRDLVEENGGGIGGRIGRRRGPNGTR